MPFYFTLTEDVNAQAPQPTPTDFVGEDISLVDGDFSETGNGDLAVVTGAAACRQSVLRELPPSPGHFPRRAELGAGLSALLFRGNTQASRDQAVARARTRLVVNPRVQSVDQVSASTDGNGLMQLDVRVTPIGAQSIDIALPVTPPKI